MTHHVDSNEEKKNVLSDVADILYCMLLYVGSIYFGWTILHLTLLWQSALLSLHHPPALRTLEAGGRQKRPIYPSRINTVSRKPI